jgi:hypothetical protein
MLYKVGHRLRLRRTLDIYNLGFFPSGSRGTITFSNLEARRDNPVISLLMDDVFPGLQDYDNTLQLYRTRDMVSEVALEEFEPCGFE